MKYFIFLLTSLFFLANSNAQIKIIKAFAPDKQTSIELTTGSEKKLTYRILSADKTVMDWSSLGLVINNVHIGENCIIQSKNEHITNEKFAWPLGEDDTITNHYNEITISCISGSLNYKLLVRLYNNSIAFRYQLPAIGNDSVEITKENTSFNLGQNYTIYQYNQESVFNPVSTDTFNTSCDFPATLTNGKLYISIGEADNQNYTKPELKRSETLHTLSVAFVRNKSIKMAGAWQSPWRTISFSRTAIGLHDHSQLFLKLATPSKSQTDWIKPGKLIRSQLTTQSGMDCINFAAKHNFQYIMFDAGWYGAEFRSVSDPTQSIAQIDMQAVIQYAKTKSIGVILYVNYVGLKARLDTLLPLYKKWGVSGFKFGFVDGLTQGGLVWLSSAIQKVNENKFILNIHDNYKPTGLSRTYPALLTQEGIRGDENSPDAFHNTTLPFTRFLAGPADFTFCYPNAKNRYSKNIKVSMAQQLALSVIYFSPLQSVFWYGNPNDYTNEQEIEFFKHVPTVWNESHFLAGDIGKNICVARRHGNTWFVGTAAGFEDWKHDIRLDFLVKGKTYIATIYEDDGKESISRRQIVVKKGNVLPVDVKAKGGQAIIIEMRDK